MKVLWYGFTRFLEQDLLCLFEVDYSALQALYQLQQFRLSVRPSVRLSVRPSVRHTPVLCQNGGTKHGADYTVG